MRLERIQFVHFRNHRSLLFEPSGGVNLIYGPNGSGKTSILEAIHYCALTKGFVNAYDVECLSVGKPFFQLKGVFADSRGQTAEVKITYSRTEGKQLSVNGRGVVSFSSHIGLIPCISFSPSDMSIVNGSPAERRRFMDNAISQTDRSYLEALLQYRRVLQHRNSLLSKDAGAHADSGILDVLAEQMAQPAARIALARLRFLLELQPLLQEYLGTLSEKEGPFLDYRCSFLPPRSDDVNHERFVGHFMEQIRCRRQEERVRSQTAVGVHRDDVVFFLHDREMRKYASQGQKRSFLIALKMALCRYFTRKLDEPPLCLFDDLFSELDRGRIESLLGLLGDFGQTIITGTEERHGYGMKVVNIFEMA